MDNDEQLNSPENGVVEKNETAELAPSVRELVNQLPGSSAKDEELAPEHREYIDRNWDKMELMEMVRKIFNNPDLDGRCKQGRMVRKYMSQNNYGYSTTHFKTREEIVLGEAQKEFVLQQAGIRMKPVEIARMLFKNQKLHHLSKETLVVQDFLKETNPLLLGDDEAVDEEYTPPKTPLQALERVCRALGVKLELKKLNAKENKNLENFMVNMHSPRYIQIMNNLTNGKERVFYEKEFIREIWDKPDLDASELNICISLINEYLEQIRVQKMINQLHDQLDAGQNGDDKSHTTVALAQTLKALYEEKNASAKRQKDFKTTISGERKNRIDQKIASSKSMVSLVEAFRDTEERKNMIRLAEMRKQLLSKEVQRLESMEEWQARIFGIDPEELLA